MNSDVDRPEVLTTAATEPEAAIIVGALEAAGVVARMVGGYTASFQAEAPGDVKILVRHEDLPTARKVLKELR